MKKIALLFAMSIFLNAEVQLPLDTSSVQGELKNGLKYIIQKNDKPKNMASLRLVVKVGSLEEGDDQQGVAHLVEHLAFNGTKHFKKNSLVSFLESLGVNFGSHLNASTGPAQTIYKLEIPLKNNNLDKAMLIFSDWAGGINFTKEELDKERGVVEEERRASNTVGYRVYKKYYETFAKDSRFTKRFPIGKEEVIKNIPLKRVKDFYDTWYQPRFMTFVAVGDFDEKKVEKLIKKSFASLKNTNKKKTYSRAFELTNEGEIKVFKDKEMDSKVLSITFFEPYKKITTKIALKEQLTKQMALGLFNEKANELSLQKNPSARGVNAYGALIGDNLTQYNFNASFKDEIKAFKQILTLMYSLEKNGFTSKELKLMKKNMQAGFKTSLKNINNTTSPQFASAYTYIVSNNDPILDDEKNIKISMKLTDEITLKEVNEAYKNIVNLNSKIVDVTVDDDYKVRLDELKKMFKNAKSFSKKLKKEKILPKKILPKLEPKKILKTSYNKEYDFYEYTLENGVKLVYKFNDYEKNAIIFDSFSKGGSSLYEIDELANVSKAPSMIDGSGFGDYNYFDITKIYSGTIFELYPYINTYYEGFHGSTTTKNFKYLLEIMYLFAHEYKLDDNVLYNTKVQLKEAFRDEKRTPSTLFRKELKKFYYKNNKRYTPFELSDVDKLNKKDILRIYKERFSDFNNFTFFVIGDISKKDFEKYAKLYLANLPSRENNETYKIRKKEHLKGKQEFIRKLNNENISNISLTYKIDKKFSTKYSSKLRVFEDVVNTKLREYIREEKSGVYGISFLTNLNRMRNKLTATIHFSCEPKRKKELLDYAKKVLKDIQENGVKQSYIDASIKKLKIALDEGKEYNSFYMNALKSSYKFNQKIITAKMLKGYLKGIDSKVIKSIADEIFSAKDVLYTELSPKKGLKK